MTMKPTARFLPLLLLLPLLAACGGPPRANALLNEAREAHTAAVNDPEIAANAPVALQEATEALRRAVAVWENKEGTEMVEHHAYIARQRVRIAEETAKYNAAQKEVEQVRNERQQVVLEARAAEAEAAQRRAEDERVRAETARAEAEAALARAQQLAEQVSELEAELTRRGLVLTLGDVLFDTGQATLKPGAQRTIGALVTFLNENPERNVLVEGFTDSVGGAEFNLGLSQRRADAVRTALVERGIPGTRIRTRGYGQEYPVASNATAAGRQQNRRVEIVISDPQGQVPDRTP
jgi:outer membrane protein OmpA-like peptidoglycan-associated protein